MTLRPYFITATVTPLHDNDTLHEEGLEHHLTDLVASGMDGLLVAGSMGAMQLLSDETYRCLVVRAVELVRGQAELIIGAGDTSFARTRDRIAFLNTLPIDGIIVLAPHFQIQTQEELLAYYRALAAEAKKPMYLYDIPQTTRTKLQIETVLKLAEHPNIAGIKCSDEPTYARQLFDMIGDRFRVVMAAIRLIDIFLRYGIQEHLDGAYCLFPRQLVALGHAAATDNWEEATRIQKEINRVMRLLVDRGVWPSLAALLHELGIPGRFAPRPTLFWNAAQERAFIEEEETQAVLRFLRGDEPVYAVSHSLQSSEKALGAPLST